MNIAITGGSGFIGTRLQKLLEEAGHRCVIIDKRAASPVDILDLPALTNALAGCDAIYHLAAEHRDDVFPRSRYYDVNVRGSENICAAADECGIKRIVFTSSFAVYGLNTGTPDETATPAPFNDYGQSKWEGEGTLQNWAAKTPGAILTIVRPVVVFGEGNRGNVHTLISQVASGKFVMVGSGKNKKSMAYVGNVAAFLHHCLNETKNGEIYNYADAPDFSMNDLISFVRGQFGQTRPVVTLPYPLGLGAGYTFDILARVTGKNFPISSVRVKKFCADTTSDASKAHRNFKPPFTMEDGLARFIAHDFSAVKKAA